MMRKNKRQNVAKKHGPAHVLAALRRLRETKTTPAKSTHRSIVRGGRERTRSVPRERPVHTLSLYP